MAGLESDFQSNYPPSPERKYVLEREDKTETNSSGKDAPPEGSPRRNKLKGGIKPNRSKSRPSPQRPLPGGQPITSSESEAGGPYDGGEELSGSEVSLTFEDTEIKFSDNVQNFDKLVKNEMKSKKEKVKLKKVAEPIYQSTETKSKEEIAREEKAKAEEAERKKKIADKKARKKAVSLLRKQQEEEGKMTISLNLPIFSKISFVVICFVGYVF